MPFEPFRTHTQPVNLADLEERFDAGAEVTPETLRAAGLAKRRHPVKILGRGRAHQEAHRPRPRLQRHGEGEDRGGRRHAARARRARSRCDRAPVEYDARQTLANSFAVPEIRKKLAFTAAMLALYRLGAYIPAPGDRHRRAQGPSSRTSPATTILGFLNLFCGGSLSRLSLFALGIMPYITASIILQLLTVVVPSLERLQKEGEVGQQKITQYTRYLTVALAFAQSLGYVFLFQSFQDAGGDERRRRR